jgi:hypothetical protein
MTPTKVAQSIPLGRRLGQGHVNTFFDTKDNERVYTFTIRLFNRPDQPNTCELELRSIADDVIDAIEGDVTLGGTCDFAEPTQATWSIVTREIPVQIVEITVSAHVKVNR